MLILSFFNKFQTVIINFIIVYFANTWYNLVKVASFVIIGFFNSVFRPVILCFKIIYWKIVIITKHKNIKIKTNSFNLEKRIKE